MKERIRHLIVLIVLILLDQISKYWVRTDLISKDIVIIPGVFKLQYHTNTGAVWGILTGKTLFLSIFTILMLLLIVLFYFKIPKEKKYIPIKIITILITAGAIGNLIDRIFLGYVVDFIYFELINFPLFNIADSYITVASIALLIFTLFIYKDEDLMFVYKIFSRKKADVPENMVDNDNDNTIDSDN